MKLPKINLKAPKINFNKELALKVINIFTLLFALTAIALSVILFNKRESLFETNNIMSNTLASSARTLDRNSGTRISSIVTETSTKESYLNPSPLKTFQKQVTDIINQRNNLSSALDQIAKDTPGAETLKSTDFSTIKSYDKSLKTLLASTAETGKLFKALPDKIIDLASKLDVALKDEDNFKKAPTTESIDKTFSTMSEKATSLQNELKEKNEELASTQDNLKKMQIELNKYINLDADYKAMIKSKDTQNIALSEQTKSLNKELDYYKNQLKKLNANKKEEIKQDEETVNYNELLQKVHGEVLKFDPKWGNAVLNIGRKFSLMTKTNGKEKKVSVTIPMNGELIVARNDKFIARIKIDQLFDNYSLASVTFPVSAKLEPGDIVFFPSDATYNLSSTAKDKTKSTQQQPAETTTETSGE